jgi:hypothetical protein
LTHGLKKAKAFQIGFGQWNSQRDALLAKGVRLFRPNASMAQDLEQEYIVYSADRRHVYVTPAHHAYD